MISSGALLLALHHPCGAFTSKRNRSHMAKWPFVSKQLAFCLTLASTMGAQICIPDAALHERAEQWIRGTLTTLSELQAKRTDAQWVLQSVGLSVSLQVPTEEELRGKYAVAERAALADYRVERIRHSSHPLREVFNMAVARGFTFEEKNTVSSAYRTV